MYVYYELVLSGFVNRILGYWLIRTINGKVFEGETFVFRLELVIHGKAFLVACLKTYIAN